MKLRLSVRALLSFLVLPLLLLGVSAFADDLAAQVPTETFLLQVLTFVSTVKGLASIAVAAGVTQLLMTALKTPLANFAGQYRLLLVALVSFVGVTLAGMASGADWKVALAQGPALTAFQVFVNQVWKQLFTPKGLESGVVPTMGK